MLLHYFSFLVIFLFITSLHSYLLNYSVKSPIFIYIESIMGIKKEKHFVYSLYAFHIIINE